MRRLVSLVPLVLGCAAEPVDEPPPRDCTGDRCNAVGSKDELLAALDGFGDPVAAFLRQAATERGTLVGNYRQVLDGVGAVMGCDATTEKSFVVLSNQSFLPKPIFTRCASDATAASQFYMAMVGREGFIDPETVHVTSWDAAAGVYRRYATAPTGTGELALNVQPEFCLGCHGGPEQLATWVPLMNEMTNPWTQWNAAPGFSSQQFDDFLEQQYADDPTYQEVTRPGLLDSAASFDPVVHQGIARVTGARVVQRTGAPDVRLALDLVRPLYCDESVNYVSEVHDSGELRMHAVVDDALRGLYRAAGADGAWSWLADTRLDLAPPADGEEPLALIPVRGESTVQAELGLVARGALTPLEALRVRALDWQHPVQSDVRCKLYRDGAARVLHGAVDTAGAATTADLVPRVYAELMKPLGTSELVASPDGAAPQPTTLAALGDAIEAYASSFRAAPAMRGVLATERARRVCRATADPTAPIFVDVACP